jgi:hypothetical protein
MSMSEGRSPMTSQGYQYLAAQSLKQNTDFSLYIFVHCFLLLCWNLIARSISISDLCYDHISWEEDSLVFKLAKTKNDQEGKHVYPR